MNVGVNFFGPKFKLYQDFDGTLDQLKANGINSAEICVAFDGGPEPPEEVKKMIPPEIFAQMKGGIWDLEIAAENLRRVRESGMTVVSCHVMTRSATPEELLQILPALRDFAEKNQIRYYVISLMKDLEGVRPYAPVLAEMSSALAQDGVALCYHNHEIECMVSEGTTALDFLMENCPDMKIELDAGWAKFAGTDPVEWMRKYRDRLVLLHFKDIKADASPETRQTCFTAVGEGSIPMRAIMEEAKNCPIDAYGLIIDQDDSETDILVDLAKGAANIRGAI